MRCRVFAIVLLTVCYCQVNAQHTIPWSNWQQRLQPAAIDSIWTIEKGNFGARPILQLSAGMVDDQDRSLGFDGAAGGALQFHSDKIQGAGQLYVQSIPDINYLGQSTAIPTLGAPSVAGANGFRTTLVSRFAACYSPWSYLSISAGYGRHHWGTGIRSMWLSDASADYPYLLFKVPVWKLEFDALYGLFTTTGPTTRGLGLNSNIGKYGSFHRITWQITDVVKTTVFEVVIWEKDDQRGLEVNYFNPLLFYRPAEFSIGSSDNALIGGALDLDWENGLGLYGQLTLDEFLMSALRDRTGWWANKFTLQAGMKWTNAFGVEGLGMIGELNAVRPYTFSHAVEAQSYSHAGQSLGHVHGANFHEMVGAVTYRGKRFEARFRAGYVRTGLDTAGINFGQDITRSNAIHFQEFNNAIGQGSRLHFVHTALDFAYNVSSKHGVQAFVNGRIWYRNMPLDQTTISSTVSVGIRAFLPTVSLDAF